MPPCYCRKMEHPGWRDCPIYCGPLCMCRGGARSGSMHVLGLIVLFLFMAVGLVMCPLTLPGPLVIFLGALLYRAIAGTETLTWGFLAVLFAIGAVCEVVEYFSSVMGARSFGASRRAVVGALVGGMAGVIIGSLAIPIIGSILGGAAGAFVGAFVAEYGKRREIGPSLKVGFGTVAGRAAAAVMKVAVGIGMSVAVLVKVF